MYESPARSPSPTTSTETETPSPDGDRAHVAHSRGPLRVASGAWATSPPRPSRRSGPTTTSAVRDGAPLVVVYGDYECPFCAALELRLRPLPVRVAFRHFPVRGAHPRAFAAACAAEAADRQGAFWPMHDALFADQGRLEDPHLWARAERLGLDLARFDADRRDGAVAARIAADFRAGVRAGRPDHADPVPRRRAARRPARRGACSRGSRTWPPERAYTGPMPAPPSRPPAEDAVLVERLRGDETGEAMRALYRLYGGELYGFTLNALGDRGAAEEIVQEVFLRAWRHAGRYDPERAGVRTWLYQIARNAIIDSRRRAAVRPGLPQHESAAEVEGGATLEQAMLGWQVAAALERLTPEHRQMIRMAQFRGLTMREIAEHTGLPLGTVKSRTWYALRSLRLVLEEMGVTPP